MGDTDECLWSSVSTHVLDTCPTCTEYETLCMSCMCTILNIMYVLNVQNMEHYVCLTYAEYGTLCVLHEYNMEHYVCPMCA